jgi:hypothetical protein
MAQTKPAAQLDWRYCRREKGVWAVVKFICGAFTSGQEKISMLYCSDFIQRSYAPLR